MNPFDMVIVVILGYCIIRGIFRGLIKEVFSAIGVLAGCYVAYFYHETVSLILSEWITAPAYLHIISFILLFCGVFLIITVIGLLIRFIVKIALLGVIDRIFGAVFGGLKAILIISLVYVLLITFLPQGGVSAVSGSKMAPQINAIAKGIVRVIPKGTRDTFNYNLNKLKKDWNRK
jgi:membrane protein required for colicin V production